MAKTKADIEKELAEVKSQLAKVKSERDALVIGVMEYEGCHQGKIDFLENAGIDVPQSDYDGTVTFNFSVKGVEYYDEDSIKYGIEEYIDNIISENEQPWSFDFYLSDPGIDVHAASYTTTGLNISFK